ncbi:MAG: type 1 periplasmic binding fold superfamily protein [Sphingobacteriales bacterium]|nr:type 1 periplasmic binding fold superfamily protein [Sphingobacteriales bacterium]
MIKHISSAALFSIILITNGCIKEPLPVNESELITTVQLTLTDTAYPYNSYSITFRDLDGDGGEDAILTPDTLRLPADRIFNASLLLLDERNPVADTINHEITEEDTAHQFFYQSIPAGFLSNFSYLDYDDNGKPLGLVFSCQSASGAANGALKIILRHAPDKSAANVSENDITNANGETDIEIAFPLIVR